VSEADSGRARLGLPGFAYAALDDERCDLRCQDSNTGEFRDAIAQPGEIVWV
jgi:hypothetical protein